MAVTTQLSLEEYLETSFEPDCEFLDGEIVERNVGEYRHSKAQRRLTVLFDKLAEKLPVHVSPEIRVRVATRRYRVIDLGVFTGEEPSEPAPSQPPLIAIEIVSRKDPYTDILNKLEEYARWGVQHVWLVDPWMRKLYTYGEAGLAEAPVLRVPEFQTEITPAEIFR